MCVTYDTTGTFPYATGNSLSQITHTRYDLGLGQITTSVDPNLLVTQWAYDGFGRETVEIPPVGGSTTTTLGSLFAPPLVCLSPPCASSYNTTVTTSVSGGDWSQSRFDGSGRLVSKQTTGAQVQSCSASSGTCSSTPMYSVDMEYDAQGLLSQRSLPYLSGDPYPTRQYIYMQHDGAGRVLSVSPPWNDNVTNDYSGLTVTTSDSVGSKVAQLDAAGRTVSVTEPLGATTTFGYGPFSATWTVNQSGDVTSVVRDADGRPTALTDPNRGTEKVDYNGFGDITKSVDAAGRVFSSTYDTLGRVQTRTEDTNGTTRFVYDTALLGSGAVALGELASITNPNGRALSYNYTALDQLHQVSLTMGSDVFTATYNYDPYDRLSALAYPNAGPNPGLEIGYTYDGYGHLVGVYDIASSAQYWTLNGTNGWGAFTNEGFPAKVVRLTDYDLTTRRVDHLQTGTSSTQYFQDLSYDYDSHFNMLGRQDVTSPFSAGTPQAEHFSYDALDRLTCGTIDNVSLAATTKNGNPPCAVSVTYYPNGNINTKSDVGTYAYDVANHHAHAVSSISGASSLNFQNDLVGNQTQRADASVVYMPFDLPASYTRADSSTTLFEYDGERNRIRQTDSGKTETTYFLDLYERRRALQTTTDQHVYFVPVGSATMEVTRQGGVADKVIVDYPDVLGSSDVIYGDSNEHRSYDAWGLQRNSNWITKVTGQFSSFYTNGYTDHEQEAQLSLVNMNGRIYDPRIARFLQSDPTEGNALVSQRWNGYSYVRNNPLRFTDPTGFQETDPGAGGGGDGAAAPPPGAIIMAEIFIMGDRPAIAPPGASSTGTDSQAPNVAAAQIAPGTPFGPPPPPPAAITPASDEPFGPPPPPIAPQAPAPPAPVPNPNDDGLFARVRNFITQPMVPYVRSQNQPRPGTVTPEGYLLDGGGRSRCIGHEGECALDAVESIGMVGEAPVVVVASAVTAARGGYSLATGEEKSTLGKVITVASIIISAAAVIEGLRSPGMNANSSGKATEETKEAMKGSKAYDQGQHTGDFVNDHPPPKNPNSAPKPGHNHLGAREAAERARENGVKMKRGIPAHQRPPWRRKGGGD